MACGRADGGRPLSDGKGATQTYENDEAVKTCYRENNPSGPDSAWYHFTRNMKATKPVSVTIFPWLKSNLGDRCLAPLTGTDHKALEAAVHLIELYAYDKDPSVIQAFGLAVRRMQLTTQELAYHSIAHVLDWSDRSRIPTSEGW